MSDVMETGDLPEKMHQVALDLRHHPDVAHPIGRLLDAGADLIDDQVAQIEQLRAALTALVDEIGTDMYYHSVEVTEKVEAALDRGGDDE